MKRLAASAPTRFCARAAAGIALLLLAAGGAPAQAPASPDSPDGFVARIESEYPGLLDAVGHLFERMRDEIGYPAPRSESRLLPLLPESTVLYLAVPNYGAAAHQAAEILRSEMKTNAVLRDAVGKNKEWAELERKMEETLDKTSGLQQFLGDEVVISGDMKGPAPTLLAAAEIRKPGLREYLEKTLAEASGNQKSGLRILDANSLRTAEAKRGSEDLLVLIGNDLIAASQDLGELRKFSAELEQKKKAGPAPAAFPKRLGREYAAGAGLLAGADLERLMKELPPLAQRGIAPLEKNGFGDVRYFVWNRKPKGAENVGEAELSFASPRRGAAAWLANSRRLTTPGFVSPKPVMSLTLVLNDPGRIFDDIKAMAGPSEHSFAALDQFEQVLHLSLKDDVLANLSGEVTLELAEFSSTQPVWRAIFGVKDAERLRKVFDTLLASSGMPAERAEEDGIAYITFPLAAPGDAAAGRREKTEPREISYALADGHLVIGAGQRVVAEAFRMHRNGGSLAKSASLLTRLPEGHGLDGSALFYQDAAAIWNLQLRRVAPRLADNMSKLLGANSPSVMGFYADDTTIREASRSAGTDVSTLMVVAAIAIPNLLRSRMAANEASAAGTVRTINTAEVTYETTYPKRGFAPALAKLGPNHADVNQPTPEHADLIDDSLATENCTPDGWCTKSGYRFHLTAVCKLNSCSEFVVTARPVASNSGTRSFCSTSDGVIRSKAAGPDPLAAPPTAAECRTWAVLR